MGPAAAPSSDLAASALALLVGHLPAGVEDAELALTDRRGAAFAREVAPAALAYWWSVGDRVAAGVPVVVRNVGTDYRCLFALAHVLDMAVYHSERLGYCDTFEVEPFTDSLSETTESGGFHTDFSTQAEPPSMVAIQCVRPDPRHPVLGRNQVARVEDALARVRQSFGEGIEERLRHLTIPHRFGTAVRTLRLMDQGANGQPIVRLHAKLVAGDLLEPPHFDGDVALHRLLLLAAADVATDIVLDTGDILMFSNHLCMHRRGECSMTFDASRRSWSGRIINSVRFCGIPRQFGQGKQRGA